MIIVVQIAILLVLFFVPGYLVLSQFNKFEDEERLSLSFGISILMYAGLGTILHLFKIPIVWSLISFPLSVLVILYKRPTFNLPWELLSLFGGTLLIGAILQAISTFPISGDSYWHYLLAKSFLTTKWTVLPFTDCYWQGIEKAFYTQYRPPLFNMVIGIAFALFGSTYLTAKLVGVLFISSLVLPTYLVAKRLYNEKVGIYSSLCFITLNPFLISSYFEVFVYPAVTYFVLCMFYLYLKREGDWTYFSIFAGLSYLIHTSSVIFIFSLILLELIKNRGIWKNISNLKIRMKYIYPIVLFILIISPWLIRNYQVFHDPFYTSGKYAPFCRDQLGDLVRLHPPTMYQYIDFISTPANFVKTKLGAIYLTFLPRPYSITFSTWEVSALWNPEYLKGSLAGFLSYPLLIVCFYGLIRYATHLIPALFYLGLGITLILYGPRCGYIGSFLLPQCFLLGIFGINLVKKKKYLIGLIVVILLLESTVIILNRHKAQLNPSEVQLYSWLRTNTFPTDTIMSTIPHAISYFTARSGFNTPNENSEIIMDCFEKWGVDYLIIGKDDYRLRKIEIEKFEEREKQVITINDYKIYKRKDIR